MPAISPKEVKKRKLSKIPEVVFTAVNSFLERGHRKIYQTELLAKLKTLAPEINSSEYFDNGWLDFEPKYRAQGWAVEYDKPGYCETYDANWTFKARR